MNYDLAKKLKDAGFPQRKNLDTDLYYILPDRIGTIKHEYAGESVIKRPTLSELIEACGSQFGNLVLRKDGQWEVCDNNLNHRAKIAEGTTPEIAVAELFLALQPVPTAPKI